MLIDIYMIKLKHKSSDTDWANWIFLKALAFVVCPGQIGDRNPKA